MRALVSRPDATAPALADVPDPTPGPGEVLVDVAAATINPADALIAAGPMREAFGLSGEVGLGYDVSGVVAAVGPQVAGLAVGNRVAGLVDALAAPARAQADRVVVPADALATLPDGLDVRDAASVPLNALTAAQALDLLGEPAGRRLLVTGAAGAVGGYALALAADLGWAVTGLARPGDAEFVGRAGADLVTQLPEAEFDAVLDAAALQDAALAAVRDGGAFVGILPPMPLTPARGIDVATVQVRPDGERLAGLLDLAAAGRLEVRIADRFALADHERAYAQLARSGRRGRVLLVP